jgi:hypothetical protein
MRKLIIAVAIGAMLGGYAYADDISDKLEQEALAVVNAHKAKVDAEDAVQRAKDAEIEKQRNVQAEALKKERLSQEQMQRASARADEARAKAEAERKARADLELRLRAADWMSSDEMGILRQEIRGEFRPQEAWGSIG